MMSDGYAKIYRFLGVGSNLPGTLLGLALAVAFFGFFYDDNLFYLVFFGIYLHYSFIRKSIARDRFNRMLIFLFVGFALVLTASNLMRILDFSITEFSGRDWRLTFHPLVVVMILDAVYSLSRHYKIRIEHVSAIAIAAIVLGTLSYILLVHDQSVADLLKQNLRRSSGLVERNVNLADDVYFFLSCSLVAMFLFFRGNRFYGAGMAIVSLGLIVIFLVMIIEGQSRAGWLGIAVGVAVALGYGMLHKRYVIPVVLIAIMIPILSYKADKIGARLFQEKGIYEDIWQQWKTTGQIDISKLDQDTGMSTFQRMKGYSNAWALFKISPWVGHGGFDTGKLQEFVPYPDNLVKITHAHNIFLDATLRQGIGVGFIYLVLILFPIFLLFWLTAKIRRVPELYYFGAILLAYCIYVFIENLVDLSYIRSDPGVRIQYLFFALCGLLLGHARQVGLIGGEQEDTSISAVQGLQEGRIG